MASRTLFYRCAAGRDAQSVDSWYLVLKEGHSFWIEHMFSQNSEPDKLVGSERLTPLQMIMAIEDLGLSGWLRSASDASSRAQKKANTAS